MKLISKVVATALAAALVVPTAFAASTTGTMTTKSHVAAMKKMSGMKGMKKGKMSGMKGMKMGGMKGMKKGM